MPPLVAVAAVTAAGAITGGALSAHASENAANLQTQAANNAAAAQAKSAADTLAFQKAQAAQDLVTANATQKANYDQWAAKEGRLSNLSALTGAGPFTIPDYVPIPNAGTGVSPTSGAPSAPSNPLVGPAVSTAPPASNPYATTMANAMMPQSSTPVPAGQSGQSDPNRLVMLKAPTGQTKMVPAPMVPHYTALGATVIG